MSRIRTRLRDLTSRRDSDAVRFIATISLAMSTLLVGPATGAHASGVHNNTVTISQTGLHIFSINGRPYGIKTAIHILTFNGIKYSIAIGLAHHAIDGGLQNTSSMCKGTPGCVAAVNGDFFDFTQFGAPDPGDEVGGIIQDCVLLHSPEISHQQVNLDGHSVSNGLNWSSTLTLNGTSVPITAVNQELPMSYSNVSLPLAGTLLYTAPYALATPSGAGRITYEFTQASGTASPTTINTTTDLTYLGQTTQPALVDTGDVDISAPASSALTSLQPGATVTLATTSTAGCDNIGGHPILLNQGVAVPIVTADTYMVKPYARTVIGWTATGVTLLMTVDGKDAVSGATAYQLDSVLESLGVVTAIDLDGGNSTTFFAQGHVLNKPSRGSEHPVSTGLLVILAS
jgi:hypothetical protein